MRSLFLVLLLANLVLFALQFDVIRAGLGATAPERRPAALNAERLRLVRDTSSRPAPTAQTPAP